MALTLSLIQHGLSELGSSPSVDEEHPASHAYLTLSLAEQQLSDISALSRFPYLTSLDLSHNPLTSLAPLSSLPHLSSLNLSHCSLSIFTLSSPLSSLLTLSLSHNLLTSLPSLSLHPFLTSLSLSHNLLPSLPPLSSLLHLRNLDTSHNALTTLSLSSLPPSLSHLLLSHCQLSSLHSLPSLPRLQWLDVSHNLLPSLDGLSAAVDDVDQHPLHTLDAGGNSVDALEQVGFLERLGHLRALTLDPSPLSRTEGYRAAVLYRLPGLLQLDGGAVVEVREVQGAWEGQGDDDERRAALRRWRLPYGDDTTEADTDAAIKTALPSTLPRARIVQRTVALPLTQPPTPAHLPSTRYWQLMAERGFVHPWTSLQPRLAEAAEVTGEVDLSGVALGEVGLRALAHFLSSSEAAERVTALDVSGCVEPSRPSSVLSMGYGLRELAEALSVTAIRALSLARCHLGVAHAAVLGSVIAAPRLLYLDLSCNLLGQHVSVDGVVVDPCPALKAVLARVEEQGRLRGLNLANNAVDAAGGEAVAEWVHRGAGGVAELVLDGNDVGDAAVERMALALRDNATLSSLSMRSLAMASTPSTVDAASLSSLLASISRYNRAITTLDLSDNVGLVDAAFPAVLSPSLTSLHLSVPSQPSSPTLPTVDFPALSSISLTGWFIPGETARALLSGASLTRVSLGRVAGISGTMAPGLLATLQVAVLEGSGEAMRANEEELVLAVAAAPQSTALTLRRFSPSVAFCAALTSALAAHPTLTSLSLLECTVSADALTAVFAQLSHRLSRLDLSGTVIPSFTYHLPPSSRLAELVLAHCGLTSISSGAVGSWQQAASLTSLDVSHNPPQRVLRRAAVVAAGVYGIAAPHAAAGRPTAVVIRVHPDAVVAAPPLRVPALRVAAQPHPRPAVGRPRGRPAADLAPPARAQRGPAAL